MNKTVTTVLLATAVLGLGVYGFTSPDGKVKIGPRAETALGFDAYIKQATPKDLPHLNFVDANGASKDNQIFKGKVTLLNLWATWCAPCRKEMPELAKLQTALGGADFQVVELSEDLKGYPASAAFLKSVGADNLTLYADEKGAALDALRAPGLPVTLLLDRDGRELGRLLGPADWAGEAAKTLIEGAIAAK